MTRGFVHMHSAQLDHAYLTVPWILAELIASAVRILFISLAHPKVAKTVPFTVLARNDSQDLAESR